GAGSGGTESRAAMRRSSPREVARARWRLRDGGQRRRRDEEQAGRTEESSGSDRNMLHGRILRRRNAAVRSRLGNSAIERVPERLSFGCPPRMCRFRLPSRRSRTERTGRFPPLIHGKRGVWIGTHSSETVVATNARKTTAVEIIVWAYAVLEAMMIGLVLWYR